MKTRNGFRVSTLIIFGLPLLNFACGQNQSPNNRDTLAEARSSNDAGPAMTVEDVVHGFEMIDLLPDQIASESDKLAWEQSLVSDDKLRPLDATSGSPEFYLDSTKDDQREVVDLRPNDTGVRNQGSESTCTAFATIAAMENIIKRTHGEFINVSERHHWTTYADYQITSSLSKASSATIVSEATWPYNGQRPSNITGNGIAKLNSYATTKLALNPVVSSLRSGKPVVIGVGILTSLMSPKEGGIVQGGTLKPGMGHAMAVTGAIIDSRVPGGGYFIVKNSWGTSWGDRGYGYVAFDYCQKAWCSAYSLADASLYDKDVLVPKPSTPQPDPTPNPQPQPTDPVVDLSPADFELTGHPSNRQTAFGMTSYFLSVDASPTVLKQIRSIEYSPSRGSSYTVYNGASGDIPVIPSNLASPDFKTRASRVSSEDVIVNLRSGQKIRLEGITVILK